MVTLPHAGNFHVDDRLFVAGWKVLWEMHGPPAKDPLSSPMPRLNSTDALATKLKSGQHFSVDVLCRCLGPYPDTMHATTQFIENNQTVVERQEAENPATNHRVQGLALTAAILLRWNTLSRPAQDEYEIAARRLLLSDRDVKQTENRDASPLNLEHSAQALPTAAVAPFVAVLASRDRASFVAALVDQIHSEEYQPHYRLHPFGEPLRGWSQRLEAYFWPSPEFSYRDTVRTLSPLECEARRLVIAHEAGTWNAQDRATAVELAHRIFTWGGVPQRDVTWEHVRLVFANAISGEPLYPNAPMNSGWTKVASIASRSLKPDRQQAIWDSRVSISIVSRLDSLIAASGKNDLKPFADIGPVKGRGGFRAKRLDRLVCNWPNGYQSWPAHFAGAQLVREMRDCLNAKPARYDRMPSPTAPNEHEDWTVCGVEMVLFGDGY